MNPFRDSETFSREIKRKILMEFKVNPSTVSELSLEVRS